MKCEHIDENVYECKFFIGRKGNLISRLPNGKIVIPRDFEPVEEKSYLVDIDERERYAFAYLHKHRFRERSRVRTWEISFERNIGIIKVDILYECPCGEKKFDLHTYEVSLDELFREFPKAKEWYEEQMFVRRIEQIYNEVKARPDEQLESLVREYYKLKEEEEVALRIAKRKAESEAMRRASELKEKYIKEELEKYRKKMLCKNCRQAYYEPIWKETYERVPKVVIEEEEEDIIGYRWHPEYEVRYSGYEWVKRRYIEKLKCPNCGYEEKPEFRIYKEHYKSEDEIYAEADEYYKSMYEGIREKLKDEYEEKVRNEFYKKFKDVKMRIVKYLSSLPLEETVAIIKYYVPERKYQWGYDEYTSIESIIRDIYKNPDSWVLSDFLTWGLIPSVGRKIGLA